MKKKDIHRTLSQVQIECVKEFLLSIETVKTKRRCYNLKHLIEGLFFYISGDELHEIMNEIGLDGDRWTHNLSMKHIEQIIVERAWKRDFFIHQLLSPDKYTKIRSENLALWGEYYETIRPWTRYPHAKEND